MPGEGQRARRRHPPSGRCKHAALEIPAMVDEQVTASKSVSRHVGECLWCQAELARYRRIRRMLRELRDEVSIELADRATISEMRSQRPKSKAGAPSPKRLVIAAATLGATLVGGVVVARTHGTS